MRHKVKNAIQGILAGAVMLVVASFVGWAIRENSLGPQSVALTPSATSAAHRAQPSATREPAATQNATQTAKRSAEPTGAPKNSATTASSPTHTPIFPIGYDPAWSVHPVSLVKFSTPPTGQTGFVLKSWDESNAIELVRLLDLYAHNQDFADTRDDRFGFHVALRPVKLAVDDALLRYPDGEYSELLQWHQALTSIWLNSPIADEWVLERIENALNSGNYQLEGINEMLKPKGFELRSLSSLTGNSARYSNCYNDLFSREETDPSEVLLAIQFPNLFGDGETAQVGWLTTQGWHGKDVLIFSIRQDGQGIYYLERILSHRDFLNGAMGNLLCVGDYTEDGVPEVIVEVSSHSGSMCHSSLHIFQWANDHFRDLSRWSIELFNCSSSWQYLIQAGDEFGIVELSHFPGGTERYTWNGKWYEPVDYWWSDGELDIHHFLSMHLAHGDYYSATQHVERAFAEWDETKIETYGPSYLDYLRFQIGFIQALQGQVSISQNTFQSLLDSPSNLQFTTVANAARAFLEEYHRASDLYIACQSALEFMATKANNFYDENGAPDSDAVRAAWGFTRSYGRPLPLCDPSQAFPMLFVALGIQPDSDVPSILREAGVTVAHSARLDVDGDSDPDWIAVIVQPGAGKQDEIDLWVFWNVEGTLVPLPILDYFEWPPKLDDALTLFRVETATLPEDNRTLTFLQSGHDLLIFDIQPRGGSFRVIKAASRSGVGSFSIRNGTSPLEFQVNYPESSNAEDWRIFRWNAEYENFDLVEAARTALQLLEDQAAEAERLLLVEGNAAAAIPQILTILNTPISEEERNAQCTSWIPEAYCLNENRSRLRYLLGLAYELTGNEANALQTYWQLWRDEPTSPYALMAQSKLEPLP